jgi:hypothetical protein
MQQDDDDVNLEAVAAMLERMALEIRATMSSRARPTPAVPERNERNVDESVLVWKKGARVRVTIRDRYYGQTGTLLYRRGTLYWDIELDPLDGQVARVIYKKQSSLTLIDEA